MIIAHKINLGSAERNIGFNIEKLEITNGEENQKVLREMIDLFIKNEGGVDKFTFTRAETVLFCNELEIDISQLVDIDHANLSFLVTGEFVRRTRSVSHKTLVEINIYNGIQFSNPIKHESFDPGKIESALKKVFLKESGGVSEQS